MARRRRGETDSLTFADAPRWLVVRDRCSHVIEFQQLPPRADLRAAMNVKRAALVAEGWQVGDIPRNCSFCFCDRGSDRWCVSVEHFEPGKLPVSHGSHFGPQTDK
jgi:hypothetical protein